MSGQPDNDPEWESTWKVHEATSMVLAAREHLRARAVEEHQPACAWAITLIERLSVEFEWGTSEHAQIHNAIAAAISDPTSVEPPPGADTARAFHLGGTLRDRT